MGVYQYAITKTKRIKGLSEHFGDIGVVEFRYKYSWSPNEKFEKYCARLDENINRKWAGKQLPILVVHKNRSLAVWVGDDANWCDGHSSAGEMPIGSSQGWDALIKWGRDNGVEIPYWLLRAGDLESKYQIPFVPTTEQAFRELDDACIADRLRKRGDRNAQPLIPNNRYWVNDELSVYA